MPKAIFICLTFCLSIYLLPAQAPYGLNWILPLQNDLMPVGKASSTYMALRGEELFLMDRQKTMKTLPYDSITHEHNEFWTTWRHGLKGIYHETKGELLPPVFERVVSTLKSENNRAFIVSKYGMNALVNDQNQ